MHTKGVHVLLGLKQTAVYVLVTGGVDLSFLTLDARCTDDTRSQLEQCIMWVF